MSIRSFILNQTFQLLYGPLVLLHEPAGRLLFGNAWHARRIRLLEKIDFPETVVDVGCGSGILIEEARQRGIAAIGIDPSTTMRRQATRRGIEVQHGTASELPLGTASTHTIICTYPGNWLLNVAVWDEFERVLAPGGTVSILLGGTYERGVRRILLNLLYGRSAREPTRFQHQQFKGDLHYIRDCWGYAIHWMGQRL